MPGVGRRDVHLGLLVLGPVEGEFQGLAVLLHGLTEAGHVAVAHDAPDPGDEPFPAAIEFAELPCQEMHQGLADGHSSRGHIFTSSA